MFFVKEINLLSKNLHFPCFSGFFAFIPLRFTILKVSLMMIKLIRGLKLK